MKYAVTALQGHQYKVSEGDVITVDLMDQEAGSEINLDQVLLVVDDDKVLIGEPLVEKAKVVAQVVGHKRGDKIRVATFKAKSRYRRVKGFRAEQTDLKIVSIK